MALGPDGASSWPDVDLWARPPTGDLGVSVTDGPAVRAGGFPPYLWAHISFPPLHGGQPMPGPLASQGCSLTWDPVPRKRAGPVHKLRDVAGADTAPTSSLQEHRSRTPEGQWGSWKPGHPQSSLARVLFPGVPPGNSLCTPSPSFMPACSHGPSQVGSPPAPSHLQPCPGSTGSRQEPSEDRVHIPLLTTPPWSPIKTPSCV